MSPSDPFDDEEDDFFANPETLNILEAVEQRAIHQASQTSGAPSRPRSSQPYHHTLAKPRNSPKLLGRGGNPIREPRPLNTEPRAGGSGFGWEHGGKRSIDGNLERHVEAIKKKEMYWASNAGRRVEEEDESPPIDVVMDASGRFELGGVGDEGIVITDNRKAQQEALGESLAAVASQSVMPAAKRKPSDDAVAARRRAIAESGVAANGNGNGNLPPRPALSRSNSASSGLGTPNALAGTSRQLAPPLMVNALQPATTAQKFNSNRALSRSVSAGVQVFNHRTTTAAGPSKLPTIPSQSEGFSDGPPPASQGSAARQAAIELERERQRRQELEAELTRLRLQAERSQQGVQVVRDVGTAGAGDGGGGEEKIKELQAQVWAAKGEAETMRRAQREEHNRHLAEVERLRTALADKDVQIKEKEIQQRRAVESIKHQAVFSNHAVQNSAVKARPQSLRMPSASQSQFRALPTPIRNGSPSRHGSFYDLDTAPLVRTVKGKGKAPPPPPPAFGKFNNAFTATPLPGMRLKRQKTEDVSPRASPVKGQSHPPSSPVRGSPARGRNGASSPAPMDDEDEEGIDWGQGQVALMGVGNDLEQRDAEEDRLPTDHKAELLYHLLNHVPLSSLQVMLGSTTEPTIYRIMNYTPPPHVANRQVYTEKCSDLLRACGDAQLAFDQLVDVIGSSLTAMLEVVAQSILNAELATLYDVAAICNVISMLASAAFLFPDLVSVAATYGISKTCRHIVKSIFVDSAFLSRLHTEFGAVPGSETDAGSLAEDAKIAAQGWHLELADNLAMLCETMCWFGDEAEVWHEVELVDVITGLIDTSLDKAIVKRGVELFYSASCLSSNFRSLIATSEEYKQQYPAEQSPLIERICRYLFTPHPTCTETESLKLSILIVRGLCMMSIADPDAAILIGQKSILVPALILVLQRESTKIWGIHAISHSSGDALSLLQPALSLLHHLVFPSPMSFSPGRASQEQDLPIGIRLPDRLHSASASKEFNGLQHIFVSAMGCMAYGLVGEEMIDESDQRSIQVLSGDLLENVVEGPEGDNIYEMYVAVDEEEEGGVGVDMDAYAEMEVEEY
ncbi:hypothetical protein IAR55_001271 [Kwoniella newhampshirensis]|uniref:Uncharacterized protein n=1 Tax=Kwoniella newhampshirensis TaxID=1651941 RepID=A0AAW0Z5A2_9TREE